VWAVAVARIVDCTRGMPRIPPNRSSWPVGVDDARSRSTPPLEAAAEPSPTRGEGDPFVHVGEGAFGDADGSPDGIVGIGHAAGDRSLSEWPSWTSAGRAHDAPPVGVEPAEDVRVEGARSGYDGARPLRAGVHPPGRDGARSVDEGRHGPGREGVRPVPEVRRWPSGGGVRAVGEGLRSPGGGGAQPARDEDVLEPSPSRGLSPLGGAETSTVAAVANPSGPGRTMDPIDRAVAVAAADPTLRAQVDAPGYQILGPWAGTARNLAFMLGGDDPADPAVAAQVCSGIADRAAVVLEAARARGELPGVSGVRVLERRTVPGRDGPLVPYHSAVALTLDGGREVVLDWHATLDVEAPKRSTPEAF
jgi:hypothetical protein